MDMQPGTKVLCTEQVYDFLDEKFVPSQSSRIGTLVLFIEPNSDPGGWMVKFDGQDGEYFFFLDELEPVQS